MVLIRSIVPIFLAVEDQYNIAVAEAEGVVDLGSSDVSESGLEL